MEIVVTVISAFISPVLVGVILHKWNARQDTRTEELEKKEDRAKEGELLNLELLMAVGKLSYATAIAVKRGKANGEVEEGVDAFEEAKKKYYSFINEEYVRNQE